VDISGEGDIAAVGADILASVNGRRLQVQRSSV
jgi:hypothetical protein